MRNDISVEIQSDPRLLKSIRELVRNYVMSSGFNDEIIDDIVLAVDEACTNSIRHSYGGKLDRRIILQISSDKNDIEFVLTDDGKPVPKEKIVPKRKTDTKIEELKPGGLGIELIRSVFDKVDFEPGTKRGNRTTMRIKRPKD